MKYVMLRVKEGEVKTLLTDCFVDAKGYIRVWEVNGTDVPTFIETQYQEATFIDSARVLLIECSHYSYIYHMPSRVGWAKLREAFNEPKPS